MVTVELNHVSILATDLEESAAFYCDVFGMERVPTPNFEVPVQWLQAGEGQLHLFERDIDPVPYYHFGITVDDFEAVYRRAEADDLFANWDDSTDGSIYLLPDGVAQMYLNDPTGNLLEVDCPDYRTLDDEILAEAFDREELEDQSGDAGEGTLNITPVQSDD